MTLLQLRQKLEALLVGRLGSYTTKGGATFDAIYVGDPPSDWTAAGLEVRIDPNREFDNASLHSVTAVITEVPVRFVQHGPGDVTEAVTRVAQALNTSNPVSIPPNEALGIAAQYTLRVRS